MAGWSMALRPLILPGCRAGSCAVTVPMATAALEKSCQHLWAPWRDRRAGWANHMGDGVVFFF